MEKCDDTRRLLGYCRAALEELRDEEPIGATWERKWASLMSLLRTACEILKREAPNWWKDQIYTPNAHIKGRVPKKSWKPAVFGAFIWTDANLFLHQGKLTTGQSAMIRLQGLAAQALVAGEQPRPIPPPEPLTKAKIGYHINTGYFAGYDAMIVAEDAILWLQQQIEGAES